ncbi:hypothetical protein HNR44_000056 [Geomicrobium halophilum]|uniref:Nuclease-related domain-containing protein n=1 Tax=Geomicrobium halophilum TaxID=549000 RepID=A0A841PGT5_9BACL|nr:hypothetical protein [Geomicrobium halophilum]MBB6448107.1 hypothetical protein [Geomicrobium halophilum]
MAHLVKLEDYISRYEVDIQRYPSQLTRLKRRRWTRLQKSWIEVNQSVDHDFHEEEDWFADANKSLFRRAFERVYKRKTSSVQVVNLRDQHLIGKSRESLRAFFYYEWLQTQLKWASSSLSEESALDSKYRYDSRLREILQVFPDNYMVFYYPIFKIQKADIQLDVLLLSPSDIYCVTFIETPLHTLLEVGSKRFWGECRGESERKRLNPLLSVNRMEDVVRSVLKSNDLSFSTKRVILAPDAIIDDIHYAHNVTMVDQRNYKQWIDQVRRHSSPMKKRQFQVADVLLRQGKTKAYKRIREVDNRLIDKEYID